GRSIGQYFHDEIASPLGLDFYIRLPEEIPDTKLATLRQAEMSLSAMRGMPISLILASMNPRSAIRRALLGSLIPLDDERIYARNFEVPSGGGVGTARAIAHAYSIFATGGEDLGLREETIEQLKAPPVAPLRGFKDRILKVEMPLSLGFLRPSPEDPFGSPSSYGAPGSGGSFGFADPEAEIGYGYVTNGMGTALTDPRDIALRTAMYQSIDKTDVYHKAS
ncbi:MAG: serine hydrolase domain-containing protein, partial [Candidatus Thorarchaeota archaeon]